MCLPSFPLAGNNKLTKPHFFRFVSQKAVNHVIQHFRRKELSGIDNFLRDGKSLAVAVRTFVTAAVEALLLIYVHGPVQISPAKVPLIIIQTRETHEVILIINTVKLGAGVCILLRAADVIDDR